MIFLMRYRYPQKCLARCIENFDQLDIFFFTLLEKNDSPTSHHVSTSPKLIFFVVKNLKGKNSFCYDFIRGTIQNLLFVNLEQIHFVRNG